MKQPNKCEWCGQPTNGEYMRFDGATWACYDCYDPDDDLDELLNNEELWERKLIVSRETKEGGN